jgi:hypothetical protein
VRDPSFRLKNGCAQDVFDTWAEDFKLSHYQTISSVDSIASFVLICDYTGKEVVE